MIASFKDEATEAVFDGDLRHPKVKKLPHDILKRAIRLLDALDASSNVEDLRRPPGNQLKKLEGARHDTWSVRINAQWRLTFKFEAGKYFEVLIEDYH